MFTTRQIRIVHLRSSILSFVVWNVICADHRHYHTILSPCITIAVARLCNITHYEYSYIGAQTCNISLWWHVSCTVCVLAVYRVIFIKREENIRFIVVFLVRLWFTIIITRIVIPYCIYYKNLLLWKQSLCVL